MHPRVRCPALKCHLDRLGVGRAEDHLADRRRLVVDEPVPRGEARLVERRRSDEADLLLRREQQLDAGVPPTLGEHAARRLEHDRDSGFVVGAQDRPGRVSHNSLVVDDRLDRAGRRDGVEVCTEKDWRSRRGGLQPRVEIAGGRADPFAGVVLVHVEGAVA